VSCNRLIWSTKLTVYQGDYSRKTVGMKTGRLPRQAALPMPWLLRRVNQHYRSAIRAKLTEVGLGDLPQPGYWALTALDRGTRDASHLMIEMGATKQAVSKLVDTLVTAGYIDRKSNEADRRRSDLLLTTKGRKAVSIIVSAVKATERGFIADVGAESFDQLRRALDQLSSSTSSDLDLRDDTRGNA
jgi:DNA-binding MarR family transcriptional regulator